MSFVSHPSDPCFPTLFTLFIALEGKERGRKKKKKKQQAFPPPLETSPFWTLQFQGDFSKKEQKNVIRFPIFSCFTFPQFSRTKTGQICACTFFSIFSRYFPLRLPTAAAAAFGGGGEEKKKKVSFRSGKSISKKKGREGAARPSPYTLVPLEGGRPPL